MTVPVHEVAVVPGEVATVTAVTEGATTVSAAAAVAGDVETALAFAGHHPAGEVAVQVRERLRGHIRALAVPAEQYADRLPEGREKEIAASTVRFALRVSRDCGSDPAMALRLLAKSVAHLARNTDLIRSD
ncbi:DUF6415 family natural product biosynthesis protein [Streptomyces avidinii]|uniref:DUF6415 family natural product biosynthesis protein n=1 Tax=Streptomyces avidinii TaxID=1895 RepID=UPI0037AF9CE3